MADCGLMNEATARGVDRLILALVLAALAAAVAVVLVLAQADPQPPAERSPGQPSNETVGP